MSESIEPLNLSNAVDRPSLPPLRLHHLLVMTAVSSVLLASFGPGLGSLANNDALGQIWIAMAVWGTIHAFVVAFAITVSAFGIFWRLRGIRFPREPGHWLLVAVAASHILTVFFALLLRVFTDYVRWNYWLAQVPAAILDVYIGFRWCVERRWRWVFYLKAFAAFVPVLGDLLLMVMISRANLRDRRMGMQRDALHRSGYLVQLMLCTLMISLVAFFVIWGMLRAMGHW